MGLLIRHQGSTPNIVEYCFYSDKRLVLKFFSLDLLWLAMVHFVNPKLNVHNLVLIFPPSCVLLSCTIPQLMAIGASGKSGSPVVVRVDLVSSIGLEHVTILCPVMEGNHAQGMRLKYNSVMCIPVQVGYFNML